MRVLWDHDGARSVRDVLDSLGDEDLAYTTVMTVLDRLARKGTVARERVGRAWLYRAATSREEFTAHLMREALDLAGDRDAALAHFAGLVSGPEARALRQALSEDARDE